MQAAISWSNYLIGVSIVAIGYYMLIGFKFYRKEISHLFSGKLIRNRLAATNKRAKDQEEFSGRDTQVMQGLFDELEEVVEDLRMAILEEAGKQTGEDDLLQILQQRLAHYSGLRKPAFRVAINHYIIRQAAETCQITFTEQQLNDAWQQVLNK